MCSRRLLTLGGSLAVSLFLVGSAVAQLPKEEQKCIDGYNNKLRLVSAQAGKSARSCVKNAAKAGTDPNTCVVTNTDGKIAGKEAKVADLYSGGKCQPAYPIQQGAAAGNAAHRNGITNFVHAVLGDPVGVLSQDKADGKCLDKGVQRSTQAITEIIKAHRSCKKNGLKSGAVIDSATLDATCGTFAQIDSGGKAAAKLNKASADAAAACAGREALFDGLDAACHASGAALGACLVAQSKCAACLILNAADGQTMNCDTFDDGSANGSCGGYPGLAIGAHTCTLANSSAIEIQLQAGGLSPVTPGGTFTIDCGTTGPNGKAACDCDVNSFDDFAIPAVGDICITPVPGCPAGEIDCDGGNALDAEFAGNHNIGSCTNDSNCQTQCDSYCAGLGPEFTRISHGCEGFCQGGVNDNLPCTNDTDCPGAQCVGSNPPGHPGVCNCACAGNGVGAAGDPGEMFCNIGVQITAQLPSDNDCSTPGTLTNIILPPICAPVSTATSLGQIRNINNSIGTHKPASKDVMNGSGGLDCNALASSSTSGMTFVGHLGFPDSTIGDLFVKQTYTCQ